MEEATKISTKVPKDSGNVAKSLEEENKKIKNLLQQRAEIFNKMVDAYSINPKVDLSGLANQANKLTNSIANMYKAMGEPKKAIRELQKLMENFAVVGLQDQKPFYNMFRNLASQLNAAKQAAKNMTDLATGEHQKRVQKQAEQDNKALQNHLRQMDEQSRKEAEAEAKKYKARQQWQQKAAEDTAKSQKAQEAKNEAKALKESEALQRHLGQMEKESKREAEAESKKYANRKKEQQRAVEKTKKNEVKDDNSRVKAYNEEYKVRKAINAENEKATKNAIANTNKAYNAMEAFEAKKAAQERKMWEAYEREQANQAKRVQSQTQREVAGYHRSEDKSAEKAARRAAQEANQINKLLNQLANIERRINRYKGEDGLVYSVKAYYAEMDRIENIRRKAEELGALNIASMTNDSMLNGVNVQYPKQKVATPVKLSEMDKFNARAAELKNLAEEAYLRFLKTKQTTDKITFTTAISQLRNMNEQAEKFERMIGQSKRSVFDPNNLKEKIRMRAGWITTGMVENTIINAFPDILDKVSEFELAMAGVQQVLPYVEKNQERVNQQFSEFANIAKSYGQATREVVEAGRSIGRMYGDGDGDQAKGARNTDILTRQAAKMATVDNFDMLEATKGLESALSQFNMQTSNSIELMARSNRILDVWTKLAHNGGASAQDLVDGVRQAGSAAHQAGVSFEFLNALIATGVRATAKSGNEIGTTLKSMFSSILADTNIKKMQDFGISIYEDAEDGTKKLRNLESVILDISLAMKNSGANAKEMREFMMKVSGGKQQFSKVEAILGNYRELVRTIKEANTSEGFTNKQLELQMDTIFRKSEALKASFDELIMNNAGKGFSNDIKYMLDWLNHMCSGLKELDIDTYSWIKHLMMAAVAWKGIYTVLPKIITQMGVVTGAVSNFRNNPFTFNSPVKKQYYESGKEIGASLAAGGEWRNSQTKDKNSMSETANSSATNKNTASKTENSTAIAANTQRVTQNTESIGTNTGVLRANAGAIVTNAGANSSHATSVTADTGATARNTQAKNALSAAIARHTRLRNLDFAAVRASTAQLNWNTAAVVRNTTSTGLMARAMKVWSGAVASATMVARGFNAVMAAFGGPFGFALTALMMAAPFFLEYAESVGEAKDAQKDFNEEIKNSQAQAANDLDVLEKKEQACENLAEHYNKLKDQLDSNTLSEQQAKEVKEQLAETDEAIAQILNKNTEQFKENGKFKIDTMKAEEKANGEQTLAQLKNNVDKAQSDLDAAKTAQYAAWERVEYCKKELEAVKTLGNGWQWLYTVIASVKSKMADAIESQIKDIKAYKESGLSDTTMTWGNGGLADDDTLGKMQEQADNLRKEAIHYDPIGSFDEAIESFDSLSEKVEAAEANLSDARMVYEEANNRVKNYTEDNREDADTGHGGAGKGDKSGKGSGSGSGSGKGAKNPSDPEKDENKREKEILDRLKKEYEQKLKRIDGALNGLKDDASLYGTTEAIFNSQMRLYKEKEALINTYTEKIKAYYGELKTKVDGIIDLEELPVGGGESEKASSVVSTAAGWQGVPYVYGGTSSSGVDCSGLVQAVYDAVGVSISRTADAQAQDFANKGLFHHGDGYEPKKGDAVFMYWGGDSGNVQGVDIDHVGIYNGDGTITHASSGQGQVVTVSSDYLSNGIVGYGDFSSYVGESGGGEKVANTMKNYISPEDWKKLSVEEQKAFSEKYKEEDKAMKAAYDRINILENAKGELAKLEEEARKHKVDVKKGTIDTVRGLIDTISKEADFKKTDELFNLGLNATDLDKEKQDLEAILANIEAISKYKNWMPENTMALKETNQTEKEKRLEYAKKQDEYETKFKDQDTSLGLEQEERDFNLTSTKIGGATQAETDEHLLRQKELLEKRYANQLEDWRKARENGNKFREEKAKEIEALEATIAKTKEQVEAGKETVKVLQDQEAELAKMKTEWNISAQYGTQQERDKQKAIDETKQKLAEVNKELHPVKAQLHDAIVDGTTSMFSDVLIEGNSFKDGWKSLWRSIAKIALDQLIRVWLFQKVLNFGGLFNGGGAVSSGGYNVMDGGGFFGLKGLATGGQIPGYAKGGNFVDGLIKGAGTGTSDSILTYLQHRKQFIRTSNGEFIVQKKAVDKLGVPFLNVLNKNPEAIKAMKRYANGGSIGYEMVPSMNPQTVSNYDAYTKNKAKSAVLKSDNSRLEKLTKEQTGVLRGMGKGGGDGKIVVLNTQASSADVMRALAENPRALQVILNRQNSRGFR